MVCYHLHRLRRQLIPVQADPGLSDPWPTAVEGPLPRPMTSLEEKVLAEVGPTRLAALGGSAPSSSLLPPLELGTAVASVGAPDA